VNPTTIRVGFDGYVWAFAAAMVAINMIKTVGRIAYSSKKPLKNY
jgi:hypothetical protein